MTKENESTDSVARRSVLAAGGATTLGALVGRVGARSNGSATVDQHTDNDGGGAADSDHHVTVPSTGCSRVSSG